MIHYHGKIEIPQGLLDHADAIKFENYKVNKPGKGQVRHKLIEYMRFTEDLRRLVGLPAERLDFVYFSCCKGAEPHVDQLPSEKFHDTTYVIPVVLPRGRSVITAEGCEAVVELGGVYQFDHTKVHSMKLEDTDSGCVVIMVAIRRSP